MSGSTGKLERFLGTLQTQEDRRANGADAQAHRQLESGTLTKASCNYPFADIVSGYLQEKAAEKAKARPDLPF
jgi:hypothetical protein